MRAARNLSVATVGLICLIAACNLILGYTGYGLPAGEGDPQVVGAVVLFGVAFICAVWLAVAYLLYIIGFESRSVRDRRERVAQLRREGQL